MSMSSSRRNRRKSETARNYRLHTVIGVDPLSQDIRQKFTDLLESAIYTASANYPAVTQYFVRLVDSEVVVGLQIEKVSPSKVQNIADALLSESVDAIEKELGLKSHTEVEETELYLV